jgi:5-methylthioadenosine/S-adenosylhomocysteine deaminase
MPAIFRTILTSALLPFLSIGAQAQVWALRGTVVTPEGPVPGATVLIDGNTIRAVGQNVPLPSGTKLIETSGFIYPGLIDLHNHVTWNILPHWASGTKSGARYDWQQLPEYRMALSLPHDRAVAEGHGCAAERYAEVKAMVGGATAQTGLGDDDLTLPGATTAPATPPPNCLGNYVRELGVSSRLYPAGAAEPLNFEISPLAYDAAHTLALIESLQNHTLQASLIHIAEGSPTDASAAHEFGFLRARGMLVPGVSIIHGVALTSSNFAAMAKASVGLIWSPRSNFELYGATTNVASAKQAGVTIAIGPDWSPTGSDGMLQELKYAAIWNATQYPVAFTDRDLFQMATLNAANLAGIAAQTGSLVAGKRADLLVLRSDQSDPYNAFTHASPEQVALVVVDGTPQYGDTTLMRQVRPSGASAALTVCGAAKELAVPTKDAWSATQAELTTSLHRWGTTLAPLTECR